MAKDYSNLRESIRYCSGIGKCENCPQDFQCNGTSGSWYMLRLITDALDELGKRVDVVRCGECENWQRDWEPAKAGTHFCANVGFSTDADWFCADGEKRRNV